MKVKVTSRKERECDHSIMDKWYLEGVTDKITIKDGYIMFHANNRDYRLYEMFFNFEIED